MNVRISQLPVAPSPITGSELVPIVQNGQTVQATVADLVASPSQTQTFLTINNEPSLPNSRYIGTGLGLGHTDSGTQGKYSLFLNGASGSLENAGLGLIVKSAVGTIINRTFTVTGAGLTITNGNGVSGNPTLTVAGLLYSLANLSGTGFIASNGSALTPLTLTGTALQIAVANGNGTSGNPVISFVNDAVFPGNAGITVPNGTTAQRPGSGNGTLRYNSDTGTFEGYANGVWGSITTGSGVTSIATGTGLTGGPITSTGTIAIANTAVSAGSYGNASTVVTFTVNAQGQLTLATNVAISISAAQINTTIPNPGLTNSSITINGNSVSLGGSTTVTASTTSALTIGTGLSGGSFNGSTPVTVAIASTGVTAGTYGSSSVIPVLTINAQGQVTSISTQATNAPAYQGTWNASTNTPTLTSSVGTAGFYYVVTVAGNTSLNGVTGWNIGDWAIFSNGAWEKIPGSSTESFTNLITTNLQIGGLTGFVYANNTTGNATAATTAQLLSLLGATPVANGGTGLTALTAGYVPYGNGTSAFASSSGFTFASGVLTAPQHVATLSVTGSLNQGAVAYGTLGYSDVNILASFASSVNTYNQMVLQNTNTGAAASTNFNVSNDLATTTTNFGEFGINSSIFSGTGSFSGAGNVYLAAASTDLVIGTYASKYIRFVVNSGATDAAQITPAGNFISNGTGTFVNGVGGGNF